MIAIPEIPSDWEGQLRFNREVAECLKAQQESMEALYEALAELDAAAKNKLIGQSEN